MVSMYIPEKGTVSLSVTDLPGKEIINNRWILDKGYHSFRFSPGSGNLFFFKATWSGISRSIKILNRDATAGNPCSLEYIGGDNRELQLKTVSGVKSSVKQSGILDTTDNNKTYSFQFAVNIPCPGTPSVTIGGQVYHTVQIFSQCWFNENLNVGNMIPGTQEMSNNNVIEKYCYNNKEDSCTKYGGLYRWDELMQYSTTSGIQGICPNGWHVPTVEEWKLLEGAVDSQYGIGDP